MHMVLYLGAKGRTRVVFVYLVLHGQVSAAFGLAGSCVLSTAVTTWGLPVIHGIGKTRFCVDAIIAGFGFFFCCFLKW